MIEVILKMSKEDLQHGKEGLCDLMIQLMEMDSINENAKEGVVFLMKIQKQLLRDS